MSNSPTPFVSVIMNCYNGDKYLREAIDSVYAQTYKNWEIVFWDNVSIDNSASIAKSYDNKIKYFLADKTTPLYDARNKAIDKCSGRVIAFLDCDDIWIEDKLEKQVAMYQEGNKFIYGAFELIDGDGEKINKNLAKLQSGYVRNKLLIRCFISIGSVLVDSKIMKQLKFNPRYNLIGDYDLWIRISEKINFSYVEGIVEKSRQHENNLSKELCSQWIIESRQLYWDLLLNTRSVIFSYYVCLFIIRSEVKSIFNAMRCLINK